MEIGARRIGSGARVTAPKAGIRGIVFDLDGVYFFNGKSSFIASMVSKYRLPEAAVRRVFLQSGEMNELYKAGKMSGDEFWGWAAKEWRIGASPKELVDLLVAGYEQNEEAARLARNLRIAGYKILICTNNFRERMDGLERRFHFRKDFDAVVSSHEIGVLKPSPIIFEALCKKAGLAPGEIFLADDRDDIVAAARQAGLTAARYEDFAGFVRDLRAAGVKL